MNYDVLLSFSLENKQSDPSQPLYPSIPTGTLGPVAPIHPTDYQKEAMEQIFRDVAGDDMEIDWMELKRILDQTMRDGNFVFIFGITHCLHYIH